MAGLTRELAEFVAGLRFSDLPAEAIETVKRGTIDCVGVMFAGRDEPVVRILKENSSDQTLIRATAAHALDYDDTGLDGHPSVILVPVMLALGREGKDMIAAYVAGYETWGELVSRDADKHHGKGWHPTAVFGTVAAAAAAARLLNLNSDQVSHTLGIAASMAAGVVANFGSMTKPFQAGRAVQNGVLAARLAAAGMTSSPDALEAPNGLLFAVSPRGRVDVAASLNPWHIVRQGINIKRYPVCYALHRAIDAALQLDVDPKEISSVEMQLGRLQAGMLRPGTPQTALDAKFSAPFAMAAAFLRRKVGLAELSDGVVRNQDIQDFMPKVRLTTTEEKDAEEPLFSPADAVSVILADGSRRASAPVRRPKGHASDPLSLEELRAKFDDCVGDALPRAQRDQLYRRLLDLEQKSGSEPDFLFGL
jgi:2-methylcitrate dehydratase PrpD